MIEATTETRGAQQPKLMQGGGRRWKCEEEWEEGCDEGLAEECEEWCEEGWKEECEEEWRGLGRSGRWVWEAVCSDSWFWRRSGEGSRATTRRRRRPTRRRSEGEDRKKGRAAAQAHA